MELPRMKVDEITGEPIASNYYSPYEILRLSGDVVFISLNSPIVTFHGDGRITLGPDAKPDEAATQFLEVLKVAFPQWIERLRTSNA